MTGRRLVIGVLVMGTIVPIILFFILGLDEFSELFSVAATCLLGWGAAHLAGDILTLPRLGGRNNPVNALRQWEQRAEDEIDL